MKNQIKIRYGWLKGMYIYTALVPGLGGMHWVILSDSSYSW